MTHHPRTIRTATTLILGLALTAGILTTASPASAATTGQAPTAASAAPAVSDAGLRFGVATPGGPTDGSELDQVATQVGESPSIVLSYADFTQSPPIAALDSVAARGAETLLTWEPWEAGAGADQPAYTNASIAAGDHDAYIREWGAALAKWGGPVYLRYAHEMNGDWYPWAEGVDGNGAGSYAAAWRHVHDVVVGAGATEVRWVWTPNVPYTGSTALAGLYPGDGYVDVVGLDGYNWGTSITGHSWVQPADLFGPGLERLRGIAPGKPIVVAETASSEVGGSKAQWDQDLVAYLQAQPDVQAFVWFDMDKEADWRIGSSASSATALRDALAARRV
ncbi:glycoside hydrolase family 26 protein [Clavibacter phaseoli]|uniref:glycoside hydrolase family 26 protein n=1 Tax=Clavibacter phaseoli TaxID=1734031 RepID=UPI000E661228|nr:glycosyl hydrolase [Clavibacter phaseoli]RIJ54727.1 beta-mannanase [Clavibacter phaseoli]UKF29613.1 beta-mannanase [Clavibacter phaseoli]UKF38218.1 beta-mannanase [Clavibacter phaseoli]